MELRTSSGAESSSNFKATEGLTSLLSCADLSSRQENLAAALQSGTLLKLLLMANIPDVPEQAVVELLSICSLCLQQLSIRDAFSAQVSEPPATLYPGCI
jgi:hypothetical protein